MLRFVILLATLGPILGKPMCGFFCDSIQGFGSAPSQGFGNAPAASYVQQPSFSANYVQQPSFSDFNQQVANSMSQFQNMQVAHKPVAYTQSRPVSAYYRPRPAYSQNLELVETVPAQTNVHQSGPMEAMFAQHSSSSSNSAMGYVKYPGVTQVQAQPIRMQPIKQPCEQYVDPCAY